MINKRGVYSTISDAPRNYTTASNCSMFALVYKLLIRKQHFLKCDVQFEKFGRIMNGKFLISELYSGSELHRCEFMANMTII